MLLLVVYPKTLIHRCNFYQGSRNSAIFVQLLNRHFQSSHKQPPFLKMAASLIFFTALLIVHTGRILNKNLFFLEINILLSLEGLASGGFVQEFVYQKGSTFALSCDVPFDNVVPLSGASPDLGSASIIGWKTPPDRVFLAPNGLLQTQVESLFVSR